MMKVIVFVQKTIKIGGIRMIMTRTIGYPNRETFKIKPIAKLLNKYVKDGKGWVDPFAGDNSPAEFTNDLNPKTKAKYHLDAVEFCNKMDRIFNGVLFDPPYSPRQIKECYDSIGLKPTMKDTQNGLLYSNIKKALYKKIKTGGCAISFGWNSGGFAKKLGFEIVEIMLVYHGGGHNDTIVVVEKKIQDVLRTSKVQEG